MMDTYRDEQTDQSPYFIPLCGEAPLKAEPEKWDNFVLIEQIALFHYRITQNSTEFYFKLIDLCGTLRYFAVRLYRLRSAYLTVTVSGLRTF